METQVDDQMLLNQPRRNRKFTDQQVAILEESFLANPRLTKERKHYIAFELGVKPCTVAVWFKNRRARSKIKKLEEDYSELKDKYDCILLENARLETENFRLETVVSSLKEQLSTKRQVEDGISITRNFLADLG